MKCRSLFLMFVMLTGLCFGGDFIFPDNGDKIIWPAGELEFNVGTSPSDSALIILNDIEFKSKTGVGSQITIDELELVSVRGTGVSAITATNILLLVASGSASIDMESGGGPITISTVGKNIILDTQQGGAVEVSGDLTVSGIITGANIGGGESLKLLGSSATEFLVVAQYVSVSQQAGANKFELRLSGTFTGGSDTDYELEIDGLSPDTFKWRKDTGGGFGAYTTEVAVPSVFTELDEAIQIAFLDSGSDVFVIGDAYSFTAVNSPTTILNVDTLTPLVTIAELLISNGLTVTDLTAGRVTFAGAAGVLTDDADLTFVTDTLTATKIGAFAAAGAINFDNQNMTNVDINSGAIDGTTVGASSASTGVFTTLTGDALVVNTSTDFNGVNLTDTGDIKPVDNTKTSGTTAASWAEIFLDGPIGAGTGTGFFLDFNIGTSFDFNNDLGTDCVVTFDASGNSPGSITYESDNDLFVTDKDWKFSGQAITDVGSLQYNSATELTISSGAVTTTQAHHGIDTEGDAANDDLDTINGGNAGEILLILANNSARTVRLRNGVGNIFLKHQVDSHAFSFSSPSGAGAAIRYAGGGWYDFATADVTLNQGSLTQTFGTANVSYAAHASIVTRVNGTVDTGTVSIVVSGTSIDDGGTRTAADSETILADITTAGTNGYHETAKKWLGTITFTLTETVANPTAYTIDFNYGLSKYEDFGNQTFTVTGLQVTGEAGANDTNFNMILFYHSSAGWTYAATGFEPGGTQLANMNTDHSTEQNLSNGEPFAWKRTDINTDIAGNSGEGIVFRVDTSAAKAVESMTGVVWVHTQPAFSYLSDTKQHLIFMKHGANWLEL